METRQGKKRKPSSEETIFVVSDEEAPFDEDSGPNAKLLRLSMTEGDVELEQNGDGNVEIVVNNDSQETEQLEEAKITVDINRDSQDIGQVDEMKMTADFNKDSQETEQMEEGKMTVDMNEDLQQVEKEKMTIDDNKDLQEAEQLDKEKMTGDVKKDFYKSEHLQEVENIVAANKVLQNNEIVEEDKLIVIEELQDIKQLQNNETKEEDKLIVIEELQDIKQLEEGEINVIANLQETEQLEENKITVNVNIDLPETEQLEEGEINVITDDNEKSVLLEPRQHYNVHESVNQHTDISKVDLAPKIIEMESPNKKIDEVNNVVNDTVQDDFSLIILDEAETPKKVTDNCDQHLKISFSTKVMADYYKDKILNFLQQFVGLKVISEEKLTIILEQSGIPELDTNSQVKNTSVIDLCSPNVTPISRKHKKHSKSKKRDKEMFVLDTMPSEDFVKTDMVYNSKFIINVKSHEDSHVKESNVTCFNCNGKHCLSDCPIEINPARVNANRRSFQSSKQVRYHLEDDQKYGHLKPGIISDNLRNALGLGHKQLPRHIYMMRKLGYPPGWLEEAKHITSSLQMFDIDGKNVKDKAAKRQPGLNRDKIIEYPGFNVPLEDGFKDEYRKHNVPPYSENYATEAMISFYEKTMVSQDDLESTDMETVATDDEAEKCPSNSNLADKSLNTLELQKKQLLLELKEGSDSSMLEELETSKNDERTRGITEERPVIGTTFGTPLIESKSTYSRLPDLNNFMKGVSPVINFENLPDSTGKYEQMTSVIQKVREMRQMNCKS